MFFSFRVLQQILVNKSTNTTNSIFQVLISSMLLTLLDNAEVFLVTGGTSVGGAFGGRTTAPPTIPPAEGD